MNTAIKTKINRIGKIGVIFAILLIISSVISLVMWTIQLFRHGQGFQSFEFTLRLILYVAMDASLIVVYAFLFRVATEFQRCDSPFENNVIRQMSVFGWILFGNAVLEALVNTPNLLTSSKDFYSSFDYVVNVFESAKALIFPSFSLVVSLIVLCMVRIFRYGAQLQKQSDETL